MDDFLGSFIWFFGQSLLSGMLADIYTVMNTARELLILTLLSLATFYSHLLLPPQILSTVERASQFTDCFEHWQVKHNREKPANKTFFAGMIGYGCNLGIRKTGKISRNIDHAQLENTIRWYFNHENIMRANDKVLSFLDQLQLPKIFKQNQDKTHTSSDGQKFGIGVDSLNAGYSYKYFGQNRPNDHIAA